MAIEITEFKPHEKNTLRGFLTARLTNIGLEIRGICLHEKNGKRWLSMPAKLWEKNGETKYVYILDFYDRQKSDQFQACALKALDDFFKKPPSAPP